MCRCGRAVPFNQDACTKNYSKIGCKWFPWGLTESLGISSRLEG